MITRLRFLAAAPRLFATLLAVLVLLPASAGAQTTKVTFLLVNDIYLMGQQAGPDGRPRGGFARLASVVKAERAKGRHVVLAHAGDTLSPSLMSGFDRGVHIIALTNMVRPDVFAPGNHEFDFGKATFLRRMAEARFPIYAANLRGPGGQPIPGIRDRAVLTFDGVRIGVTGATYEDTPRTSSSEDLKFLPTVATAQEQAKALRQEGADFVVAVVHADRAQDLALAATRAVDLILSGHDHDLFVTFDGRTATVESSHDAQYVTAVDVTISVRNENGTRRTVWWPQFRIIDTATVVPDARVASAVASFERELGREMDVPLGKTEVELDSRSATVRTREAAIGNLIADAMRQSARADAAVMNGGGIRAGRIYPPGTTLTRRDILAEMPFNNRVVTVEIAGRELRRALENGLALAPQAAGRFPQVSGLTIDADLARPAGSRITAISVGGSPLVDDKLYTVAINDFLARGGDGYTAFRDARHLLPDDDSPLLANEVMVHIKTLGVVRTGVEGRIVLR